ncbi:374a0878-d820-4398-8a84-d5930919bb2c [Thermothielavioides terrestris]|uniref:374a0878-d820-4398-8a84-d5930919bb2c n=1 Tax=Thermothielavioides terrestris TaxID=2587410 RepID=A0A3S4BLS7_9PEZI|nr:374a0878-d820-4398-8a84-d5930919bb2c [Thermothielavioides terrestris]
MVALTPVVAGVQTGNNGHLRRSKSTGKVAGRAEKGSGRSSSDAPEKKDKEKPKDRGWSWTSWWQ